MPPTTTIMTNASSPAFTFPTTYSFPPFFTPQPNSSTRHSQLQKWSSLIQAWCRHHRIYRLSLIDAIDSPLFHNSVLRKRVSLSEARAIVDWMVKSEEDGGGGRRAEWVSGGAGGVSGTGEGAGGSGVGGTGAAGKIVAWIWWRRPEEWAELLADWVSWDRAFFLVGEISTWDYL
jgi:ESCRT-II complex subunit VPS25